MQRVVAKISIPTPDGNHHQLFRFPFDTTDQRFNELRQFVQQKYSGDFVLRYKDDEGDLCTIGHEEDVTEALHTAQSMNAMLKIHVSGAKMNELADLDMEVSTLEIPNLVEMIPEPVVEESPERSAAPDIPELEEEIAVGGQEEMPLVSFEEAAPKPDPMERLFVATDELLKVYRSRFGVLLLIELNKILQLREIHPKNYPAEIAMIINTQNEFSDILQNPLYLDVVGPALFKVILPDEFIIRVNANASLLKQLDARSIAEYAETMIGSLCASAGECKDKFTLRPSNVSSTAPVIIAPAVVPVNLDPLEPAPVREEETNPKEQRGILSSVLNSWPWSAPKQEDPVPFVEPNAPVVAPPRNSSNTDFDILSFVDESLDNARDDEKASEERPSSLVVTPASHISYREAEEDVVEVMDDDDVPELVREDEPLEDEDVAAEQEVEAAIESEVELEDDEADDLKQSVVEEEPRGRHLTHPNTLCSLCGMHPISGIRYKCIVCSDMHMCSDCEMSGLHDRTHPVIKFATATQRLYAPHELSGLKDLVDPQYHTMFFTDIQVERAGEDAMNMSTYSAVSAASINPILMMRYMAESLRNPTALSRILDPIPNDDGESVSSASEFEVDVAVEEDAPDVRYQAPPNEPSPEPEIEFPQDDDFEVAEASTDEVDFDIKVDADVEPVIPATPEPVVEDVAPQEVEQAQPQPQPQAQAQPQPKPQQQVQSKPPQRPPVYQPPQQQYPSMQYQYQPQYYAPGMTHPQFNGQAYQQPAYPYQQYQQYRPNPYQYYSVPAQQQQQPPRGPPVQKPPPPPKEEELNDDFLLESQPEAVVEPPEQPATKVVPVQPPAQPKPKPRQQGEVQAPPQVSPVPRVNVQPQPAVQPVVKPPAVRQPAAPSQNYVPPVVSNLPAYPILKAPEEKSQPAQAKPKPAEPAKAVVEELSCYCGVPLVKMPVGDLGSVVQCDVCNVKVSKGQVYHCFEQSNHGSGGYDMCEGCVDHQIAGSRSDRLPQTTHAGPDPSDSVAPSAPPSAPPSAMSSPATTAATSAVAPAIPPELEAHRKYKFFNGLVNLQEMGIGDVETNKKLLKIHKGNVSAVMQQYFDGNVSGYHY